MVVEIPISREAGMGLESRMEIADRFATYVGELTKVIGHADREGPLHDYCSGLLATEGRRSVEPMAAVTAPARVSAQHQKLLHFVAIACWPSRLQRPFIDASVAPVAFRGTSDRIYDAVVLSVPPPSSAGFRPDP